MATWLFHTQLAASLSPFQTQEHIKRMGFKYLANFCRTNATAALVLLFTRVPQQINNQHSTVPRSIAEFLLLSVPFLAALASPLAEFWATSASSAQLSTTCAGGTQQRVAEPTRSASLPAQRPRSPAPPAAARTAPSPEEPRCAQPRPWLADTTGKTP